MVTLCSDYWSYSTFGTEFSCYSDRHVDISWSCSKKAWRDLIDPSVIIAFLLQKCMSVHLNINNLKCFIYIIA